jgi:hypothetical protein
MSRKDWGRSRAAGAERGVLICSSIAGVRPATRSIDLTDLAVTRGAYLPAHAGSSSPRLLCKSSIYTGTAPWVTLNALTATAREYPTRTTSSGPHAGHWSVARLNGNTDQGTGSYIYLGAGRVGSVWIGRPHEPTCACDYGSPPFHQTGLGRYVNGASPTCSTWVR